jgi:lysozyme
MISQALIEQLKLHEGVEKYPYVDTVGKMTIGVGRNLTDRGISTATIEQMLIEDIELVQDELDKLHPDWCKLSEKRQRVLIDMCFNLGAPRLNTFTKFWKALKSHRYTEASQEMLDSKWANQVGQRAHTLSKMMNEG